METEFWAVWEVAGRYFASDATEAFRQGVTGGLARRRGSALTYSDLHAWLIPGLAALGVQAELLPLLEETVLRGPFLRGASLPVFAFSGPIETLPSEAEEPPSDEIPEETPEPIITRQGLLKKQIQARRLIWGETKGAEESGTWEKLRERFSHGLALRRAARKGLRREHLQAVWLRWLAYSDAYPERIPTGTEADAPVRALAATFLHSAAGKQGDRVSNRLRRAAEAYAQGDVPMGMERLRQAIVSALSLPEVVQSALLSDPALASLSGIERRELIYLARAGMRDLKVLAARRLTYEAHHADVRSTLQLLRYDPDPWVRSASRA